MVEVNWQEAMAYAEWLGGKPAHRGAVGVRGAGGGWADLSVGRGGADPRACRYDAGRYGPRQVLRGRQDARGVYDLAGNVWEWCRDWYYGDYPTGGARKWIPVGPETGEYRVLRGGSFRADERTRTADLLITNQLLYQLSWKRGRLLPIGWSSLTRSVSLSNAEALMATTYSTYEAKAKFSEIMRKVGKGNTSISLTGVKKWQKLDL